MNEVKMEKQGNLTRENRVKHARKMSEDEKLSRSEALAVAAAIHSSAASVTVRGCDPLRVAACVGGASIGSIRARSTAHAIVRRTPTNVRAVRIGTVDAVAQNPAKDSKFARAAQRGARVTWFMPKG